MNRTLAALILLYISLASCEKDANHVRLPEFEQKLVVNAFLSPRDTLSIISVTSNNRLYGVINENTSLGNITATLGNGTKEISPLLSGERFVFRRNDMKIEEGKTYTFRVSTSKGLSAEASATIPIRRPLKIEIDTSSIFYPYGDGTDNGWWEYYADIYLTDYPGESNYYRFAGKEIIYNSNYSFYPYDYDLYPSDPLVFTDKGRDGKRFLINRVTFDNASEDDSAHLVIYVLITDKDYYTYHYSMDNYAGGGDPFTEVSPAWSNIKGGLGIFASYVVDSAVFRVR
jgi:hypothetical protein